MRLEEVSEETKPYSQEGEMGPRRLLTALQRFRFESLETVTRMAASSIVMTEIMARKFERGLW